MCALDGKMDYTRIRVLTHRNQELGVMNAMVSARLLFCDPKKQRSDNHCPHLGNDKKINKNRFSSLHRILTVCLGSNGSKKNY